MAPKRAEAEPRGRGARAKLRAYFLAHVGEVLEGRDLREVAGGITEWARRVRELRSLDGFQIETDKDDSTLRPGQYRLASAKPRPRIAAAISKQTRAYVLDRNGFTCQMCGAVAGEPHPNDSSRRTRLHIGHIQDVSHGGSDEPSNLRALCSLCNEGAQNITAPRPKLTQLLTQVRRATVADQQEVLAWLRRKFPDLSSRPA